VWIGLYEPTELEFESVRREFVLHELAVEDAITAHQRPKLEVYDDSLFVVLKTARLPRGGGEVEFGEVPALHRA
jgi:magnesium transporter